MSAWVYNYSTSSIDNTMRGRTGMTKVFDRDIDIYDDYIYYLTLPFEIEPFKSRKANEIWVYTHPPTYIKFGILDGYDKYIDTNLYLWWKYPEDLPAPNDYGDTRNGQTNWLGYSVDGDAPNRVFTCRAEFQTYDSITNILSANTKIYEYVFNENAPDKIDIRTSSPDSEPIEIQLYGYNNITLDAPYINEDSLAEPDKDYKVFGNEGSGIRLNLSDTWDTSVPEGGGASGGSGGSPTNGTGEAFNYQRVWNSAGLANTASTTGLVAIYEPSNGHIVITNIQNVANTRLVAQKFKVGEQLYSNTGPAYNVQNMDQIIYLDTAKGGNGYGFTANQTIRQTLPDGTIVSGKVVQENVVPPLIYVTESNAKFRKYPITNGVVTANVVGALSPPLKGEVVFFMPYYVINRNGKYDYINRDEYDNFTFSAANNSVLGDILVIRPASYPYPITNTDSNYIVANYNDTQSLIPRGNMKDRWTDANTTYTAIKLTANNENMNMLFDVYSENANNQYDYGQFYVYPDGFTYMDNETFTGDRYIHGSNKALMIHGNGNSNIWQLGANTSSIYNTVFLPQGGGPASDDSSSNIARVWIEWNSILTLLGSNVDTIHFQKADDPPLYLYSPYIGWYWSQAEGQQDPYKTAVHNATLIVKSGTRIKREAWRKYHTFLWPNGIPPKEMDVNYDRIFHFMNIHDPINTANNNVWYCFNASGEVLFPWFKDNRPHTYTLTYSWTSAGGTDLDTRTWITVPSGLYDGQNNIVGWNYNSEVRMGAKLCSNGTNMLTFSGDDTSSGGYETIQVPIDAIAFNPNYPELTAKTSHANNQVSGGYEDTLDSYIDIHCGAYWYNTRNSGNFTLTIHNDVTGYTYSDTFNVQHRNTVGIGPNEFAVYRVHLEHLRMEKIV